MNVTVQYTDEVKTVQHPNAVIVFKFFSEIYELTAHFKDDAITNLKPSLFVTSLAIRVLIVTTHTYLGREILVGQYWIECIG